MGARSWRRSESPRRYIRLLAVTCWDFIIARLGGLPPNLQGIWAEEIHTPWTGDWHLDMNVEMNYWPAEVCNLSDLTGPLFALIASLQEPGAKTAKDYYNARGLGCACHHQSLGLYFSG